MNAKSKTLVTRECSWATAAKDEPMLVVLQVAMRGDMLLVPAINSKGRGWAELHADARTVQSVQTRVETVQSVDSIGVHRGGN